MTPSKRIAEPIPQEWWEKRCAWYSGELDRLKASLAAVEAERDALVGIVLATKIRLALDAAKYDLNSLELPEGVEVTTNLGRLDMEAERKQRDAVNIYDAWRRTQEGGR